MNKGEGNIVHAMLPSFSCQSYFSETPVHVEKYRRLFDRGLVVRRDGRISVNVPVMLNTLPEFDLFEGVDMAEFRSVMRAFGERCADIEAPLYPKHMQDCIRAHCMAATYCELMYFYEWMLANGCLTLPEDDRRNGLLTLVTAAALPTK